MKEFKEPDWSNSETSLSEMWKNPIIPAEDRLLIADGAIHFRDETIKNLRRQIKELKEAINTIAGNVGK